MHVAYNRQEGYVLMEIELKVLRLNCLKWLGVS